jgi:hypothetical protein
MPTFKLTTFASIVSPAESADFETLAARDKAVCNAWVDIMPITGNERVVAQQLYASATYSIVMRKQRTTISPRMVVVANGDRYPITSVLEAPEGYVKMMCVKAVC